MLEKRLDMANWRLSNVPIVTKDRKSGFLALLIVRNDDSVFCGSDGVY